MKKFVIALSAVLVISCCKTPEIPLPEHPRPDFERAEFVNLNGYWNFSFSSDEASTALEANNAEALSSKILVPFPWGSNLSEVKDEGDIAWYARSIKVPSSWKGKRVFVVVGASDWETSAWIDGKELGSHKGGYTPFEFELTDNVTFGKPQNLFFKVDDTYADWHLYGKQGYGNARGIWQTIYLEARGANYIEKIHFYPDIDNSKVGVEVTLDAQASEDCTLQLAFADGLKADCTIGAGQKKVFFDVALENQHLWSLDDPYLYELEASLNADGRKIDAVNTYFGQRKISAMKVPGCDYKYIALNNSPLYVQLCLDQSYHPDGFYTFPSDEFMKNEILISKNLGLTGNRVHIKAEVPRKLYWADKLGLLIMEDVPNFWGEPTPAAREEWQACMEAEVSRDFNHPSVFSWVDFNETWGLFTTDSEGRNYKKETQEWVRSMYKLTKQLDPTRLVEDNSVCNLDHVETDINSWHSYQMNQVWESNIAWYDENMYPGSAFNFIGGNVAGDEPIINSECGNVWGYSGSAGDCDYTWDYHEMMNAFHRHLKIGGWLYTEHHDVINEWNGYVRFDRTPKYDGLDAFVPGMSIKDLHTPYYIVPGTHIGMEAKAGEEVTIPIYSSFVTDKDPGTMTLEVRAVGCDGNGGTVDYGAATYPVEFVPFKLSKICDASAKAPLWNDLVVVRMVLRNAAGEVLSRNFSVVKVEGEGYCAPGNRVSFAPASFADASWSVKQSSVYEGLKVNGLETDISNIQ